MLESNDNSYDFSVVLFLKMPYNFGRGSCFVLLFWWYRISKNVSFPTREHMKNPSISNSYLFEIEDILTPVPNGEPLVIDLFAGSGGLALGFEARGFKTLAFEKDKDCCATYQKNLHGKCHEVELTVESDFPSASVVIGGPPCQPSS